MFPCETIRTPSISLVYRLWQDADSILEACEQPLRDLDNLRRPLIPMATERLERELEKAFTNLMDERNQLKEKTRLKASQIGKLTPFQRLK